MFRQTLELTTASPSSSTETMTDCITSNAHILKAASDHLLVGTGMLPTKPAELHVFCSNVIEVIKTAIDSKCFATIINGCETNQFDSFYTTSTSTMTTTASTTAATSAMTSSTQTPHLSSSPIDETALVIGISASVAMLLCISALCYKNASRIMPKRNPATLFATKDASPKTLEEGKLTVSNSQNPLS